MSRRPGIEPTGQAPCAVRLMAANPRSQSLLRFDVEDDPGHGSLLYEAVVSQDTTQLTDDGWLDRLEAITRIKARLAAVEAETIAGFDDALHGVSADLGHRRPESGDRNATASERRWIAGDLRSVADEIALVLTLRRGHATQRIHTSCELVHNFPATLCALNQGHLTERAAFTIVSELSVLDDLADIHAAEAAVLGWATTHPLVDLKQACRRETARRSPAATNKAHQRAKDNRSVRMYTDDLGRADLVHNQDAVDAAAVMTSLSRAALYRRRQGDLRTMDQLRADIAIARLLPRSRQLTAEQAGVPVRDPDDCCPDPCPPGYCTTCDHGSNSTALSGDSLDEAGPAGPETTVVIHATGPEVHALIVRAQGTGGEVDHHGPIPQNSLRKHLVKALAQALLADQLNPLAPGGGEIRGNSALPAICGSSRVELQVTDQPPPGEPDRYKPSALLDRYVRWRDRTCRFPGCNHPAEFTDLDHCFPFAAGGRTTAANLQCLCRHHHRLKHEGGWQTHHRPDGTTQWTSPTGRRYHNSLTHP